MSAAIEQPWPDDVPAPAEPNDIDEEAAALEALFREEQRLRDQAEPAPPAAPWGPTDPLALELWNRLPHTGRGVDYVTTLRSVARAEWPFFVVQQAALGLVLAGRIYVSPAAGGGSWIGRGNDPRCGEGTYRTGAITL